MSTKPIQNTDIASPDVYTKLITETKELLEIYKTLDVELTKVVKNVAKVSQGYKSNVAGDIQKAAAAEKQLTQAMLDSEKIKRAKIQTEKSLISLQQQKERATQREIKQRVDLKNAYTQESRTLTSLIKQYQNLASQGRENGKVAKGLLQEITRLDTKLKGIDKTVGRSQRNVGNYSSALDGLKGRMNQLIGVASRLGLVMGGGMIVRNTVNIIKDYEQANANLASILGVTADQTEKLQKLQLELGGSTSFTAAQVAELQTEYAKLGFTQEEILKATEGTLFLAKAAGTDLANAAEIAGSTLRAFNLDASEMGRVTDVMAKSFSTSALDIEKFKESMKLVAPIASAAGVSLEEATAMLGALANAGISGSMAGTSLRRILNEMALTGKPAAEALKELSEQGISLADAEDEVGKNAQTALLVLSKNGEVVADLTDKYQNASGTAKEMAEVQDNTLGGALARLNSAWEAFILNMNESSGAGASLRRIIEFLARNLTTILNTVIMVSKAFLVYKTTLLAVNTKTKVSNTLNAIRTNGLKAMFVSQTALNKATDKGTKAVRGLNSAMKANIFALIIVGLYEISDALGFFKTRADAAAESQNMLNEAMQEGVDIATKQTELMQSEVDAIAKSRVQELVKLGKTEEEIIQEVSDLYKKEANDRLLQNQKEIKAIDDKILALKKLGNYNPITGQMNFAGGNPEDYKKLLKDIAKLEGERNKLLDFSDEQFSNISNLGEVQEKIQGFLDLYLKKTKGNLDPTKKLGLQGQKELTGLEKLQKELSDLEKKRSDLLVKNGGEIDKQFISLTNQSNELKNQIDAYKLVLENVEKIERAKAKGLQIDTQRGKSTLATGDVDLTQIGTSRGKTAEELKAELDSLKQLSEQFTNFTVMLIDRRIEALDRENEAQQRNYDEAKSREQELIELRKAGVVNLEESIAFEREAQAKALQEQEKIAKKKQRLELTNSAIQMFNASVQQGGANPLGKTIADVTALVGFIRTLPAFWTGTDSTVGDALGIKYSNGRDGVLARVDASEMILNKSKVDTLKGYGITTTDGIIDAIEMQKFSPKSTNMTSPIVYNDNSEVIKELQGHKQLLQQIANKPVVQNDIEHFDKMIKISQTITTPKKVQTITKNTRIR